MDSFVSRWGRVQGKTTSIFDEFTKDSARYTYLFYPVRTDVVYN